MELDAESRMILEQFDTFCAVMLIVLQKEEKDAHVETKGKVKRRTRLVVL
jgi:hypothetical protein